MGTRGQGDKETRRQGDKGEKCVGWAVLSAVSDVYWRYRTADQPREQFNLNENRAALRNIKFG